MSLMRSDVMFKVDGAKYVEGQKVKLRPIEHHYKKENKPEKIKYSYVKVYLGNTQIKC